jgi:hypothetical protein
MHRAYVDIENEFIEIAKEADRLSHFLSHLSPLTDERGGQAAWEAVHVCASATEKRYTGCERVMARIANEFDRAPVARSDGWHAALLRRMAHPFPGVRDAIITARCHHLLDRLRAFRHRERNTYGINLDLDIVLERSREAVETFAIFRAEVMSRLDAAG